MWVHVVPLRRVFLVTALLAGGLSACQSVSTGKPPISTGGSGGGSGSGGTGGSVDYPNGGTGGVAAGGSGGSGGGTGGSATGGGGGTGGSGNGGAGGGGTSDGSPPLTGDGGPATNAGGPILLVIANDPDPSPDNGMKAELTAQGLAFVVQNSSMMPLQPGSAEGKSLVIINPNVPRGNVPATFKDVAVPVIVSKDGPATQMMMATGVGSTDPAQTQITITMAGDPLAASLPMGKVTVYPKGNRVIFGTPGPGGKTVATTNGGAAIFYYPTGAEMAGGFKAPAKRVGFFWHRTSDVTPDGRKLFVAAIKWALAP
jgi:hypothetical protein